MSEVKACARLNDHKLKDISVINPGDWFGKTWLIEIGGSYCPLFLIVEADTIQDAIDELADNEKYGHNIIVADEDLADYDAETCNYGPSGQVIDLDHLMIHGAEGVGRDTFCNQTNGVSSRFVTGSGTFASGTCGPAISIAGHGETDDLHRDFDGLPGA